MDAVADGAPAQSGEPTRRCVLCRMGVLRWLTLLSFNLAYVVVPLLLFERTRSLVLVGTAMIFEGLLRAVLALWVGAGYRRLGAQRGMLIACALRLAGLGLLALSVSHFSVVLVALGSTLFYIGHFFATLEQELRSATFGERAVEVQTVHRVAEVVAPPVAFALALAGGSLQREYAVLLASAALAVLVHGAGFFLWFGRGVHVPQAGPSLSEGWRHLRASPVLVRGLVGSIVGFTFFGWAVLATPFALTGRHLFDLALDSAAGIALFKTVAALVGVAGALLWGRWLGRAGGDRGVVLVTVATPLAFAFALTVESDAAAVALLAVVCAMLLGLFTWQRRLRQVLAAPEHFHAVTSWCMALECLHVSLVGLALIVDQPWVLGVAGSAILLVVLGRGATR